ncbi:MAG: FG-GAP-like repeat-containing protein [Saprospiraceae bacterium]|nr:FG-GAP-like repeat-containing protein [Saprospiraceae bacterium]
MNHLTRSFPLLLAAATGILFPVHVGAQAFTEMSVETGFDVSGHNRGIAIGDFNGDGLEDIYVSRLFGVNLLYKNLGNFQFEEVSDEMGVRSNHDTNAALWFDFDNDGDLDLFLACSFDPNVLYRNDGDGFTDVTAEYGLGTSASSKSAHAVDYDRDGDLDLFVAIFLEQNELWRNDGDGFTNVITESGLDDPGRSLGAIFFDYDLDGDDDLYQTRDGIDPNLFFRNNGDGTFTEISTQLGLDYVGLGMGCDIADLNGDGRPDIYLTNLYENKLYLSDANSGGFYEFSGPARVDDIGMGWSTVFFDCDNDGLTDLYLANDSHFSVNGEEDIRNRLFVNLGDMTFFSKDTIGGVQNVLGSYGAATADFDLDGALDLAIANSGNQDYNQIFRNTGSTGHFIAFDLRGTASNPQGIGSRVTIHYNGEVQTDWVYAGSGYVSQNSVRMHFGIGDATSVDSVVIHWSSGIHQVVEAPPVDQLSVIEENDFTVPPGLVVWTEPPFPTVDDDVTVYYNAAEGNGALAGFTGQVFAHTGLITSESNNGNDWKHVVGNWGQFDSRVIMIPVEEDIYSISYNIRDYYGVPVGEEVLQMAFVFRNLDGSIVGRASDGSDIFTDVFPDDGLLVTLTPDYDQLIRQGDSIAVQFLINRVASVTITDNGESIYTDSTNVGSFTIIAGTPGSHEVVMQAISDEDTVQRSFEYFVVEPSTIADPPHGTRDGLNYWTDSTYLFQLYAPGKEFAFLTCPANDYQPDTAFRMMLSEDSTRWWIERPRSDFENGRNAYLYLLDNGVGAADPYSELILDPWHDQWVSEEVMQGLPEHPGGNVPAVTVFDLENEPYPWTTNDFEKPANRDLVIYEVLLRDFLQDHSYASLIDTLDYLEKLGVNAIELMPIQEFEGNDSWGYNPSFHMAVDKYYGSRDQLKAFIDEAHSRGIAVILDVVFNHVFSQSPLARLYWDAGNSRPAEDNPWLNPVPRHPFNVGYDVNHESPASNEWVKRILEHWITEYRFDGFRFDLSKGFTQKWSSDDGLFRLYDAGRIAILKDYADFVWSLDSASYIILEHFAEQAEEEELANYGMMLWGTHHQFKEAAMGYPSDLEVADYTWQGFNEPHLIGIMESHDEERLIYTIREYGDVGPDQNTRDFETALRRVEAISTIFYSIPGPKMLWQFGELGYDYSINRCVNGTIDPGCRLDPKPIRWDFLQQAPRKRLFDVTAAMIHLKTNYPTWSTDDYVFSDGNFYLKTIHLNHPDMDAVVMANYRITNSDINPKFPYPGTWYEYFTGDSLEVVDTQEKLTHGPGEYRIYTSERITPPGGFITSTIDIRHAVSIDVWPNPVAGEREVYVAWEPGRTLQSVQLFTLSGRAVPLDITQHGDLLRLRMPIGLPEGMYTVQLRAEDGVFVGKVVVGK